MKKYLGLNIALFIILAWATHLVFLLQVDLGLHPWLVVPGLLMQTFLYTGMFITAHDAIHGAIAPRKHKQNAAIGAFCLFVYALFPYFKVREKHFDHHRFAGTLKDPDYHNGKQTSFWLWYVHFLLTYITWQQFVGMAFIFNVLHHVLHVPIANLLLFWVAPALFSTLQLFYFGTYLPHREPKNGYDNPHHAKSNDYTVFWSFLTCYHFGYHWEHHEYPGTPWWRLPEKRFT
jgi:beta-carotene ketolase (CrtW type)